MLDLPLEYALIEFKDAKFSGRIIPELLHLAERRGEGGHEEANG